MDLTKFDTKAAAQAGADLHLNNPATGALLYDDESGEAVAIQLLGSDSREYQAAGHRAATKRLDQAGRSGRIKLTADELDEERLACLLDVTTGWSYITVGGEHLECTRVNARRVYTDFPWIREQAENFVNDRGNFLGK
jgi:hypothetical protein